VSGETTVKATIDRLMNRLRSRLGRRCDTLTFTLRDAGPHAVITCGFAHNSDGVWRSHTFTLELEGRGPLERARGVAEIFAAWEGLVLSVDAAALSEAHRWAE
jgi:hypothetical protein